MRTRRRKPQRGILLLIVLSLLVLFILIGITFIVVAGQYTRAAKAFARHDLRGDDPQRELDQAAELLLRGSTNPNDLLYRHSLLEDVYGNDGFTGTVTAVTPASQVPLPAATFWRVQFVDMSRTARATDNFYAGSVFTLLDGMGAGHSTRIVSYTKPTLVGSPAPTGVLIIKAFDDLPSGFSPEQTAKFLVNGKPFNGTGEGFGVDPLTGRMDVIRENLLGPGSDPVPFALMPFQRPPLPLGQPNRPIGESDESWDAADYQNVFLARVPSGRPPSGVFPADDPLLPSFHRPYLINYWAQQLHAAGGNLALPTPEISRLRRGIIARPLPGLAPGSGTNWPEAHPLFTGSNPKFNAALDTDRDGIPDYIDADNDGTLVDLDNDGLLDIPIVRGPWDVDNDGDGIADSMWVDLGASVKTAPDGRLYKPLYAILCVDMDGRVNVNAHSSVQTLAQLNSRVPPIANFAPDPTAATVQGTPASALERVPMGQGYGPAEIRLERVIEAVGNAAGINVVTQLQIARDVIARRYQPRNQIFNQPTPHPLYPDQFPENPPAPGWPDGPARYPVANSLLSSLHLWGLPADYTAPGILDATNTPAILQPGEGNHYLTPPDLTGTGAIYLDLHGQPRYRDLLNLTDLNSQTYALLGRKSYTLNLPTLSISSQNNPAHDDPYELSLVVPQGGDDTYDAYDLEQLLRYNDLDAQTFLTPLSMMLRNPNLLPGQDPVPLLRGRVTTHSFDIPTLHAAIPDDDDRSQLQALAASELQRLGSTPVNNPAAYSTLSSTSVVDLFRLRLIQGIRAADPNDPRLNDPAQLELFLQRQMQLQLPPDIRQGKRFDVNRMFGNGVDEDGDLAIDEFDELATQAQVVYAGSPFQAPAQIGHDDPNFVGVPSNQTNPYFAKQQFARYLYCLAMLAADEGWTIPQDESPTLNDPVRRREATARRLAQWAINVVDFRDRDAGMTPFEYDVDPFDQNGWSVDDDFRTDDSTATPATNDRRIVWGCEYPELLITETKAFHDRRVRDTRNERVDPDDNDTGTMAAFRFPPENANDDMNDNTLDFDGTLDQLRIPQGSLFIELYAAGNSSRRNTGAWPLELYDIEGRLDLARTVPNQQAPSPVWRIAIAEPDSPSLELESWNEAEDLAVLAPAFLPRRPSAAQELQDFFTLVNDQSMAARFPGDVPPDTRLRYSRFVLFTDTAPQGAMPPGIYYYNRGRTQLNYREARLFPGQYAVVGPRPATAIGSQSGQPQNDASQPSPQRIVLAPDFVHYYDLTGNEVPTISKPVVSIIAAADPPAQWPNSNRTAPQGIGINISEPNPNDPTAPYYQEPITSWPPGPGIDLDPGPGANREYREPPSYYDNLQTPTGTLPDIPFDNPDPAGANRRPLQQLGMRGIPLTGTHPRFRVALLQRLADPTRPWNATTNPYLTIDSQAIDLTVFNGEENPPSQAAWEIAANPPWDNNEPYDIADDPNAPNRREIMFGSRERGDLRNQAAGNIRAPNIWNPFSSDPQPSQPGVGAAVFWNFPLRQTFGALNTTYGPRRAGPAEYVGAPQRPFPWLTWNNRPFVSQLELMLVPSSAPWRLPFEMREVSRPGGNITETLHAPFGHLLNFRYEDPNGPDPNFSVLLDWLEVPSRFVGTQEFVRFNFAQSVPELWPLRPPFNKVSRFRDPGKVNLNTMVDATVWGAVGNQSAGGVDTGASWPDLQQSLRGIERPAGAPVPSAADRPAFLANPLRAAGSADLMPLESLQRSPSQVSLLRPHPSDDDELLFSFDPGPPNDAISPETNPYFAYYSAQRLANLVTSHSNVYAVWITVGYFEVLPWPNINGQPQPDAFHPDGYQLAAELGSDTGQIKRHRAFYLIDRSIPVGYQRGQSHNVQNTILLRRIIE
jgi:hypothetical protein